MPTFTKEILRPGTYTVKRRDGSSTRVYIGPERIKKINSTFAEMRKAGLQIPAPFFHDPKAKPVRLEAGKSDIDSFNNGGFWEKVWIRNGRLMGRIDASGSEEDSSTPAGKIAKGTVRRVSPVIKSSWMDGAENSYEDALTHIALVTHPVQTEQDEFERGDKSTVTDDGGALAITFSNESFVGADDMTDIGPNDPTSNDGTAMGSVKASSARVKDIVRMFKMLDQPISLPDDTTADNLLERLATAITAIVGMKDDDDDEEGTVKEPPTKAKEKPSAVALSQEDQAMFETLVSNNAVNPWTGKPFTKEDVAKLNGAKPAAPTQTELSQEQQALVNYATTQVQEAKKHRISQLVKTGKITAKYAKEELVPLLNSDTIAFSTEGAPLETALDKILKVLERQPAGLNLTGPAPTRKRTKAKKVNLFGEEAFSLDDVMEEEHEEDGDEFAARQSIEDADAIVDIQFRNSGLAHLTGTRQTQGDHTGS